MSDFFDLVVGQLRGVTVIQIIQQRASRRILIGGGQLLKVANGLIPKLGHII